MDITEITKLFTTLENMQYGSPIHESKLKEATALLKQYHHDAMKRRVKAAAQAMNAALACSK